MKLPVTSPRAAIIRFISQIIEAFAQPSTSELDPRSPAARELAYDAYIRENV